MFRLRSAAVTSRLLASEKLWDACQRGEREVVLDLLLRRWCDMEFRKYDYTPLHIASERGHFEVAQLLLQHNADVNSKAQDDYTPLYIASHQGHLEVAQLLLQHNADVNSKAQYDYTPLHIASQQGHFEVAQLLLQHNADVNSKAQDDYTPLHIASHHGRLEVAQLLLQHNADVNSKAQDGGTPLYIASQQGHLEVAQLLLQRIADVNSIILRQKAEETVKSAIDIIATNKQEDVSSLMNRISQEIFCPLADILMPKIGVVLLDWFDIIRLRRGEQSLVSVVSNLLQTTANGPSTQIAAKSSDHKTPAMEQPCVPHERYKLGIDKMVAGSWLAAFNFFQAQVQQDPSDVMANMLLQLTKLKANLGYDPVSILAELEALYVSRCTTEDGTSAMDLLTKAADKRLQGYASILRRGPLQWDPLRAIAYTVAHAACASQLTASGSSSAKQHRALAAAHALSFLLIPTESRTVIKGHLVKIATGTFASFSVDLAAIMGSGTAEVVTDASPPMNIAQEWESFKKRKNIGTSALDKIMSMTGMESIKKTFSELYTSILLDRARGIDPCKQRYHIRLEGNPGTGKTTMARLFAEMLKELKILRAAAMKETTGAALVHGGVTELKKLLDELDKDGGGLLFVDEAYMLSPKDALSQGKQVLNYLIPEMENKHGRLVVAFAGYTKEMEDLFEFNEGLPSRFPIRAIFNDFSDEQLLSIFEQQMKSAGGSMPFHYHNNDPKYGRIATRDLGRQRGTRGFGNARDVVNLFERVRRRQSERVIQLQKERDPTTSDLFELQRSDILGPRAADVEKTSKAWQELHEMIGLPNVKESVQSLVQLVKRNEELREAERPLLNVSLNRVFLGNPGTGKTTVASIYGRLLRDLGLLSKGEVVMKAASDFIGSVIGASEENTRNILNAAKGCVLVIDEAYGLHSGKMSHPDPYKTAVINTLVEVVQNVPGDDRCVIMLGYEDEMRQMMRECNPGLSRRLQFDDAFRFDDFSDEDLLQILDMKMRKQDLNADAQARLAAINILADQRNKLNFGNGGAVSNILSRAILSMQKRPGGSMQLLASDFDPNYGKQKESEESLFEGLIGCDAVVQMLRQYRATILFSREKGQDAVASGKLELNFRFVGPPGTGKTTVAQRLGRMFQALGVLQNDRVYAHSASDFSTGYVGQAGGKTRELLTEALGGVLFIDEAYRFRDNSFGVEAANELVQCLTEPKFKGKLVVVLAGYEEEIDQLMQTNPGLRSRFSQKMVFTKFAVPESCSLLQQVLRKEDLELSEDVSDHLPHLMQKLVDLPSFSSGRDINTWAQRIYREVANRRYGSHTATSDSSEKVTLADVERSLMSLLQEHDSAPHTTQYKAPDHETAAQANQSFVPPVITTRGRVHAQQRPPSSATGFADSEHFNSADIQTIEEAIRDLRITVLDANALKMLENRVGSELMGIHERFKQRELDLQAKKRREEEQHMEMLKNARKVAEADALQKRLADEERAQKKLQQMGVCVAGYRWIKRPEGYQCAGGSHFVSNADLK